MTVAGDYPNCREIASTVIVTELGRLVGPSSIERLVRGTPVEQA